MCVFDIHVTETESKSYRGQDSQKIINRMEKKKKYLKTCLDRNQLFSLLIYSVDGLAGIETRGAERKLASL